MQALDLAPEPAPSPALALWLRDPNSLTLRLKSLCRRFDVERLREWRGPAMRAGPDWQQGDPLWHREVLLKLDGVPWVYALTEVPLATFAAGDIDFQNLGSQPLGEALFGASQMRRGPVEVARYAMDSRPAMVALSVGQQPVEGLWGRGRTFRLSGRALRVNEVFLPYAEQRLGSSGNQRSSGEPKGV
ncbi:chorismate--pyruvate lyase family protein [Ferrimonas marina]|uniref:Probable chorismate pyruvate-lyase n=1 Tax=Ferrimonas marina TaxID=299255 RepID=A0A1M5XS51_9GAMM|nr:chorismate lyase [Ferrimonas marina]SHI02647.1 chorismate lyase [Ferrimonas marina]